DNARRPRRSRRGPGGSRRTPAAGVGAPRVLRRLQAPGLRHHAARSARPPRRHRAGAGSAGAPLPGWPARLRRRGRPSADERREPDPPAPAPALRAPARLRGGRPGPRRRGGAGGVAGRRRARRRLRTPDRGRARGGGRGGNRAAPHLHGGAQARGEALLRGARPSGPRPPAGRLRPPHARRPPARAGPAADRPGGWAAPLGTLTPPPPPPGPLASPSTLAL